MATFCLVPVSVYFSHKSPFISSLILSRFLFLHPVIHCASQIPGWRLDTAPVLVGAEKWDKVKMEEDELGRAHANSALAWTL